MNDLFRRVLNERPDGVFFFGWGGGCVGSPGLDGFPPPQYPPTPPPSPPKGKDASDKTKESSDKGKDASDATWNVNTIGKGALGLRGAAGVSSSDDDPNKAPEWSVAVPDDEIVEDAAFQVSPEKRVFLAVLKDKAQDKAPDPNLVASHMEYIHNLTRQGKLDSAGAFASGDRGLQILVAESPEEAKDLVRNDPLYQNGFYTGFDLDEIVYP